MDTIPNELLVKIIDKINDYDLLPLQAVSTHWMSVVDGIKLKRKNAFSKSIKTCNVIWKRLASTDQERCAADQELLPEDFCKVSSARYGRFVYIFGGQNGHNHLYSFDLSTYKWRCIATSGNMPTPRDYCTFVTFKDKLLVFGGYFDRRYLDDTYIFDTTLEQWNEVTCGEGSRPTARMSSSGSAVGHALVMFGGSTYGGYLNDVWMLDARTLKWNICDIHGVKPPSSSYHSQFTVRGDKIIVCGGLKFGLDIWLLDITERYWANLRVDSISLAPVESYFYSPVLIDEFIVVLGRGRGEGRFTEHMHILDCTRVESALACEWLMCGPLMPSLPPRRFITSSAGEGEIVLFGGEDHKPGGTSSTTPEIIVIRGKAKLN